MAGNGRPGEYGTGANAAALDAIQAGRHETVFYDSATAERTCLGRFCYEVNCPHWYKMTSVRTIHSEWDLCWWSCICCPRGRKLEQFDTDIIADIEANQSCFQICINEGNIILHRLPGGDPSNPNLKFELESVPDVFHLFDIMSWELSKLNLKNYVGKTLGRRMGARVQDWGVGGVGRGGDGPATAFTYKNGEIVFYDSRLAQRTCFGAMLNHGCCLPHYYKFTSERVVYSKWDWTPGKCLGFEQLCCGKLRCPCGRTIRFFDADIIHDTDAYQRICQICYNEGDLYIYRLAGADLDNPATKFKIKAVPEVYKVFDDLSYEISKLKLKSYVQDAMGRNMMYTADDALSSGAAPPSLGSSQPSADEAAPMLLKLGGSSRPPPPGGSVVSQPTAQAAGAHSSLSKVSRV